MKKTIFCLILIVTFLISCKDDPFYDVPIEFKGVNEIFSDSINAELFINNIYTEQPADISPSFNWMEGNAMFASASDEAMHVQSNKTSPSAPQRMSAGNWGPTNMRFYRNTSRATTDELNLGRWYKWGGYRGIGLANTAIKNLPLLPSSIALSYRNRLMGEAIFLRALNHFHLFQMWGGIPIVNVAFKSTDDMQLKRNTVEETVKFISDELLRAAQLLPETQYTIAEQVGRADRGACYAYRSRLLLYAASQLYNGTGFDGTANKLICYGNYKLDRWKEAAEAAQMVIDLGWYQLYASASSENSSNSTSQYGGKGQQNYHQLFNEWGTGNKNTEMIFGRIRYLNQNVEADNFPSGFTNSTGGTCPSQDLVDAYGMNDGSLFDWNNPTYRANPYANRDPRFYASIIYDGALYNKFNTENYIFDLIYDGTNRRNTDLTKTETGYYLYKFMDYVSCNPVAKTGTSYHVWMDIRYAEVLLNYAEAANEFGGPTYTVVGAKTTTTPVQAIDAIRTRAGMPSVEITLIKRGWALNQENLRQLIREERRVELAFENHRYYDIRRWMIVDKLPQYIRGIDIRNENNVKIYNPMIKVEDKIFYPKHYFFPIPQVELDRNSQLVQNPQW